MMYDAANSVEVTLMLLLHFEFGRKSRLDTSNLPSALMPIRDHERPFA
jgi:hypothetical protein